MVACSGLFWKRVPFVDGWVVWDEKKSVRWRLSELG